MILPHKIVACFALMACSFQAALSESLAQPPASQNTVIQAPAIYQVDYGHPIANSKDMWWCESARKVGQHRVFPPKERRTGVVPLELARNEYEAVQVVARPNKTVNNVMVIASDFKGPRGARLASEHIAIAQVEYVGVQFPTDRIGASGYWPDPLPPVKTPITLKADTNQPFWITAFAPKDTPAGIYKGSIRFSGDGWRREVSLQIRVWDFTLPDETHIRSGLGLTHGRIAPYHNVAGKELEKVGDLYLENFARHRISSYYPHYGADIKVDWGDIAQAAWPGGTLDKNQLYNGSESLRVEDKDPKGTRAIQSPRISIKAGEKYQLKWAARTATDKQLYRVTVETFDVNGEWRSGGNTDIAIAGSTDWTQHSEDVSAKLQDPKVSAISIVLRPVQWTERGEHTGVAWFDEVQFLNEAGEDLFKGSGHFFANKNPVTAETVKLDFTDFDRAITRAIEKYKITGFRIPIEGRFVGSQARYTSGNISGHGQDTPEFDILFGSYLRQLQDHLESKGWLDMAYFYWADEPQPTIFPQLAEMSRTIKRHAPKIKWLLTLNHPQDSLIDLVDIWTPILHEYKPDIAAARKAQGKENWWYICTAPKAPYVGEFIDHPALEPRLWLWQSWQNKVDGILIWTTVLWNSPAKYPGQLQNPWKDAMSWTGHGGQWGNGDGRFLYPPNRDPNNDKRKYIEGPVDSMRWELLRDGIEDYEYFWMLQQQVNTLEKRANLNAAQRSWLARARELLVVPSNISANLTQYTNDPVVLLNRRAQIATAIGSGAQLLQ